VGVVVLAFLAYGWVTDYLDERARAPWMELIGEVQGALAEGGRHIETDGEYGEMGSPEGKVLVWSRDRTRPDTFGVEVTSLAASPEECSMVVFVKTQKLSVGGYGTGAGNAWRWFADIIVVEESDDGWELVFADRIAGPQPPTMDSSGYGAAGEPVTPRVQEWLEEHL
jgi:hypothetical protein